jgi:hypothetical protein
MVSSAMLLSLGLHFKVNGYRSSSRLFLPLIHELLKSVLSTTALQKAPVVLYIAKSFPQM